MQERNERAYIHSQTHAYIQTHIHTRVYFCACVCVCARARACVCVWSLCVRVPVWIRIHTHQFAHILSLTTALMCVCVYLRACVCACVYIIEWNRIQKQIVPILWGESSKVIVEVEPYSLVQRVRLGLRQPTAGWWRGPVFWYLLYRVQEPSSTPPHPLPHAHPLPPSITHSPIHPFAYTHLLACPLTLYPRGHELTCGKAEFVLRLW